MKTQSKKNIIFSWFLQKNHYNNQCYDEVMIYFINTHHKMIKINDWKVKYWVLDITDEPMLNWTNADWKVVLVPSLLEHRENRIDIVDDWWSAEVYFHWELDWVYSVRKAKERLQYLIDEEDYYNWNEKDYWEYEF